MVDPMDTETPEQADTSRGYVVELCVHPDGTFTVDGPEPYDEEQQENEDHGEPLPNIGQALRAVMKIVEANPIGKSPQESFEAGYATGPHLM